MLARLIKLSSLMGALRRDALEKKAVVGVLGSAVGKGVQLAAKHPIAALSTVAAVSASKGKYQQNMSKFRNAHGASTFSDQQVPTPPGVG